MAPMGDLRGLGRFEQLSPQPTPRLRRSRTNKKKRRAVPRRTRPVLFALSCYLTVAYSTWLRPAITSRSRQTGTAPENSRNTSPYFWTAFWGALGR